MKVFWLQWELQYPTYKVSLWFETQLWKVPSLSPALSPLIFLRSHHFKYLAEMVKVLIRQIIYLSHRGSVWKCRLITLCMIKLYKVVVQVNKKIFCIFFNGQLCLVFKASNLGCRCFNFCIFRCSRIHNLISLAETLNLSPSLYV